MIAAALGLALLSPPTVTIQVEGEGWLRFLRDGRAVYAKSASLVAEGGRLAHLTGPSLLPEVAAASVDGLSIQNGDVLLGSSKAGKIVLARFPNGGLTPDGAFHIAADRPVLGAPGSDGFGTVRIVGQRAPAKNDPAPVLPPTQEEVAAGIIQVTIKSESEVEGDELLLGHFAQLHGAPADTARAAAVSLGSTPPLGSRRRIDRSLVASRLKLAGFDQEKIKVILPGSAYVQRKGQILTPDVLVKAAITAAEEKFDEDIALSPLQQPQPLRLPMGDVKIIAEDVRASGSQAHVRLAVSVDGKPTERVTIRLANSAPVTTLKTGDTIKVVVISGAAKVETTGTIRHINQAQNRVTVVAPTGAVLVGRLNDQGFIEVNL